MEIRVKAGDCVHTLSIASFLFFICNLVEGFSYTYI
jgi:hypothetical protein